jgi:DNA-binding MarR family transcriptional regulator
MKLTPKQLALLTAIDNSEYGDQLCDAVWTFSISDNSDLAPKSVPGIIASLIQKGLVLSGGDGTDQDEYFVHMTEAGAAAYLAVVGKSRKSPPTPVVRV